jgi:hypothetical protein
MQRTTEELEKVLKEFGRRLHWEREQNTRNQHKIFKQKTIALVKTIRKNSILCCTRVEQHICGNKEQPYWSNSVDAHVRQFSIRVFSI